MSILFSNNKKRISNIIILIIVIIVCLSVVPNAVFATDNSAKEDSLLNKYLNESKYKKIAVTLDPEKRKKTELPEGGGTSDNRAKTQGGIGEQEIFQEAQKKKAEEREAERQRQIRENQIRIQNVRRAARSEFTALNPIKGVTDADAAKDPSKFFNGMFMFGVSIAAFLAVLMIAIGGIQYMSTDAVSGKTEGRERIQYAVMGLLLVLFSWILLKQINPEILNFNFLNKDISGSDISGYTSRQDSQSGQSTSNINNNFTYYKDEDVYTGQNEQGFYKVIGEDKDGNEIRFYPDLQTEPGGNNAARNQTQESIYRNSVENFEEQNEANLGDEGIMTDTQRLQRTVDEINKELFNN